jgi:regulator of protease activity HflC (stomatin/prohibitin superfamily)
MLFFSKYAVYEYQTGLVYRHGRFVRSISAGMHIFWGGGYELKTVDSRQQFCTVQGQEILTNDQMPVKMSAVVTYMALDAKKFHESYEYPENVIFIQTQMMLREVVATYSFDHILEHTSDLTPIMTEKLQATCESMGVGIKSVVIRDVMIPGALRKAHLATTIAKKEGLAALERARGESAALRSLLNSANLLKEHPELLQLRTLQALEAGKGSSIVVDLTKKSTST